MNELMIGWASRDVTTAAPVNIPGQFSMRISQGVLDPVTVTALVLDNGSDLAIFLSADLVVIRSYLVDEVRRKVQILNPAIAVEKILLHATHTHAAPSHYLGQDPVGVGDQVLSSVSTPLNGEVPDCGITIASSDDYRNFLSDQAAAAIVDAYGRRAPGGIAFGYGYAAVAHSRRVVYFDDYGQRQPAQMNGFMVDGHGKMYGPTRDPQFSHYEAGTESFINLLYTFDPQQRLTGAIINLPCPAQNSEHISKLSADYWHDVRERLRAEYGGIFVLPQCAAAGDLSPHILHYKEAQERRLRLKYGHDADGSPIARDLGVRKDAAERIVAAFAEVLDWAKKDIRTALPLVHRVENVWLSKRLISDDEVANCRQMLDALNQQSFLHSGTPQEQLAFNSRLVAQRNRFKRILNRHQAQQSEPRLPMELHVLRLGDVAFASNRFELYMDYMHRIQARSPFVQTFVVQLCGVPGPEGGTYLATERGGQSKGYSACLFCNLVSPQGGQELVDETVRILNEIASPPAQ